MTFPSSTPSARVTPRLLVAALASLGACSDDTPCHSDGGTAGGRDLSPPADLRPAVDLLPRCELPFDNRAIDQVSAGAATVMPAPGDPTVYTAELDATAGGSMNADKNPFLYFDLIGRKKVAITDVQAPGSSDWDIAFKRWQIKLNSGDSGPGNVTVSRLPGKTLADVSSAPTSGYSADQYFDARCMLTTDPIGGLGTALSDWYDYEAGTNRLVPKAEVLVLPRRDGQGHIKLQLGGYYQGMVGAHYSLSWSYLP